jgi:urea transporter
LRDRYDNVLTRPRNPHLIVLVYTAVQAVDWTRSATSASGGVSKGFVVFSVVLNVLILVGLWLFERWLWLLLIALSVVAEVTAVFFVVRDHSAAAAVGFVLVALQIGLLLHPSLRFAMRKR